jgi:hypothetical protein
MRHITNDHADRYAAAKRDEQAAARASGALATARERITEAAGRDITPELARELRAADDALRPVFARLFELQVQTHDRAQLIASAAAAPVLAPSDGEGPHYDGEWEEQTERHPVTPVPFDGIEVAS